MDHMETRIRLRDFDQAAGRHNVILLEGIGVEPANLGVTDNNHVARCHRLLPAFIFGKISLDYQNFRMKLTQDRRVCRMLVDRYNFGETTLLKPRD
jgi:hypothetical protein